MFWSLSYLLVPVVGIDRLANVTTLVAWYICVVLVTHNVDMVHEKLLWRKHGVAFRTCKAFVGVLAWFQLAALVRLPLVVHCFRLRLLNIFQPFQFRLSLRRFPEGQKRRRWSHVWKLGCDGEKLIDKNKAEFDSKLANKISINWQNIEYLKHKIYGFTITW